MQGCKARREMCQLSAAVVTCLSRPRVLSRCPLPQPGGTGKARMYIASLGVLAPYRGHRIGAFGYLSEGAAKCGTCQMQRCAASTALSASTPCTVDSSHCPFSLASPAPASCRLPTAAAPSAKAPCTLGPPSVFASPACPAPAPRRLSAAAALLGGHWRG